MVEQAQQVRAEMTMASTRRRPVAALVAGMVLSACLVQEAAQAQDAATEGRTRRVREELAYPVTTLDLRDDVALEVGGLAVINGPEGARILAATRRGEVWGIDGFAGAQPSTKAKLVKVVEGLHEPLGLLPEPDGSIVTACRGQLSRLIDRDGDFLYESLETISDWWDISGNYHEYNFGPTRGVDGGYWITTNKPFGSQPFGKVEWRGFALKVLPD
ncbi:MAG: hypothetical protein AAGG01_22410, partial [Planctomycetota bacterium]